MHREIGVLRVTSAGSDGSAGLTFQKKGRGSKRECEKQLAGTKNNCMALQKITMAIKSVLSFLEGKEGKKR